MAKPKSKNKYPRITISLPPDVHKTLLEISKTQDRSQSNIVKRALLQYAKSPQ